MATRLKVGGCFCLALLLVMFGTHEKAGADEAIGSSPFEFHSFVWVNLHHYLYNEAFRSDKAHQPINGLSVREGARVAAAIEFYRAHYQGRDLLFDDELQQITSQLIEAKNSGRLPPLKIPDDVRRTLENVYPIYERHLWVTQDEENRRWIAATTNLMHRYGSAVQSDLERVLQRRFSDGPYRVFPVHEANWSGGYTFTPPHTLISSSRPDYAGFGALEMVFHESLHAGPFEPVQTAIAAEFANHQAKDDHDLWHAVLFFSAGETVRQALRADGIEYVPYAYKNGLFAPTRSWGKFEPTIRKNWLPYMQGHGGMHDAIANMVADVLE